MSFYRYLRDRGGFIALYAAMMLFVSLIMLVSVNKQHALNNIAYANAGCLLMAAFYLVIGYFYRRSFYRQLSDITSSDQEEWMAALPEPQSAEQELCLDTLKKIGKDQFATTNRIQREMKDHQDFILSWIHEVKTPIAASRLLMENRAGKTSDAVIDKLEDELGKIDSYVEQALYYSRIDSFSRDYFISDVPLDSIVKASVKKYAKLFIHKKIRPDMEQVTHSVNSDGKWLAYIVQQAVANSLAYTDGGGEIVFRSEDDDVEKRLIIADSGIGIESADIARVFYKGFTGSNGRAYGKSTGMGLYLAKQMALKLGHDLSVQSPEGAGTTVKVHFPKVSRYDDLR